MERLGSLEGIEARERTPEMLELERLRLVVWSSDAEWRISTFGARALALWQRYGDRALREINRLFDEAERSK